jgi:hypothetical protein
MQMQPIGNVAPMPMGRTLEQPKQAAGRSWRSRGRGSSRSVSVSGGDNDLSRSAAQAVPRSNNRRVHLG